MDHSVVVIGTHTDLECLCPAEHLLTYFREFLKTALISVLARPRRPLRMNPNLSPGARLGHYEIRSKIGAGGMGDYRGVPESHIDRTRHRHANDRAGPCVRGVREEGRSYQGARRLEQPVKASLRLVVPDREYLCGPWRQR